MNPDYETLGYAVTEGVATITLNRPQVLNSLNERLLTELLDALGRVTSDGVRALVLTGAGRGFCAGADLAAGGVPLDSQGRPDLGEPMRRFYNPLARAIATLPIPVVVAVNGIAAGGGVGLALAGDVVIAARSASFRQTFVGIGLLPDVGSTWLMPRLVGRARALGAAMLGEAIGAEQAADWGMIWEVVDDADLQARAAALATKLAGLPRRALAATREAIDASLGNDLGTQLELERDHQQHLGRSADFAEGVQAFLEKRAPRFTGG